MARMKKSPTKSMVEASERLAGLKSIDKNLDLGNGLTVVAFEAKIDATYTIMEEHNTMLAQIDEKSNDFDAAEKDLREIHELALLAVAVKYGKDSNEYEKAGGKRKSERKRPVKKPKPE